MDDLNAAIQQGVAGTAYTAVFTSWNDSARGATPSGGVSCFGPSIVDANLVLDSGKPVLVVRPPNLDERVVQIPTAELSVVDEGKPRLLSGLLADANAFKTRYGFTLESGASRDADRAVVRFQVCFVPDNGQLAMGVYPYWNESQLVLFGNAQQTSASIVRGRSKVYARHDGSEHWLKAQASEFGVKGAQTMTAEQAAKAQAEGKATAQFVGTRAMGTRFNVFFCASIPLHTERVVTRGIDPMFQEVYVPKGGAYTPKGGSGSPGSFVMPGRGRGVAKQLSASSPAFGAPASNFSFGGTTAPASGGFGASSPAFCFGAPSRPAQLSAAHMSIGTKLGPVTRHDGKTFKRSEHPITITFIVTVAVEGGVPTAEQVREACENLDELYRAHAGSYHLSDKPAPVFTPPPWTPPVFPME